MTRRKTPPVEFVLLPSVGLPDPEAVLELLARTRAAPQLKPDQPRRKRKRS